MDNTQTEDIKDQFGSTASDIDQEQPEVKVPVIGEYKTEDKFIEFIGSKGNMNFISNEATIDAKYLSGLGLDGVILKLTICDEGTVNFDEVDTNVTTKEQRGRLLDIISEKTVTPFRKRMVVQELPFISTKQFNDSNINMYLSVEFNTPISKLAGLLDSEPVEISDEQSSKLDALMSMFDDDEVEKDSTTDESVATSVVEVKPEPKEQVINLTEQSFNKIKENKIIELTTRMDNKKRELQRFKMDITQSEKKVKDAEDDIKLLEDRLESLQPQEQSTGYYFNVSERLNEKINLDPEVAQIIKNKISKVKSINAEAFMKLFEDGEYRIRLGKMVDGEVKEIEDYKSLSTSLSEVATSRIKKISGIGLDEESNLIYHGDASWGDLINKMIKLGFAQDADFDKYCGSNSYKVNQVEVNDDRFQLTDENGNILPDTTEASTALANAIGNMYSQNDEDESIDDA